MVSELSDSLRRPPATRTRSTSAARAPDHPSAAQAPIDPCEIGPVIKDQPCSISPESCQMLEPIVRPSKYAVGMPVSRQNAGVHRARIVDEAVGFQVRPAWRDRTTCPQRCVAER